MSEPTLHPAFKEFLSLLTSHGVKFIIVGAHALAVLGRPRVTNDIDILVKPARLNARRLAKALSDFGFEEYARRAEEHFSVPDHMATLGREPVRIDLLSSISGVSFEDAWKGRVRARLDGLQLAFLGLDEMKRTKAAAGRTKDLLDLALLAELEPQERTPRASRRKPKSGR